MKKVFKTLNVILIIATLVGGVAYYEHRELLIKGISSSGFAIIGIVNLVYALKLKSKVTNIKFSVLMSIGLVCCLIADVVLNINFIKGALIFAVGHILYIAAYCSRKKFTVHDLFVIAIISTASVLFISVSPIFIFESVLMKMVCISYAIVISFMIGKSISNLILECNTVNAIIAIGSTLFYFSDLMLALDMFANAHKITKALCLFTYYPAQCILAYSIFHFIIDQTKNRR